MISLIETLLGAFKDGILKSLFGMRLVRMVFICDFLEIFRQDTNFGNSNFLETSICIVDSSRQLQTKLSH